MQYWIWNYDLLLYLKAIINTVGSYDAPPPPESMLVWVGGRYVLCAADIPTLIQGRGEIGIVPTLLTMIVEWYLLGVIHEKWNKILLEKSNRYPSKLIGHEKKRLEQCRAST